MMLFFLVTALISGVAAILLTRRRLDPRLAAKPANFGFAGGFPLKALGAEPRTSPVLWAQIVGRVDRFVPPRLPWWRRMRAAWRAWRRECVSRVRSVRIRITNARYGHAPIECTRAELSDSWSLWKQVADEFRQERRRALERAFPDYGEVVS